MKTLTMLFRALVFGGALLFGLTAVAASRFVLTTIAAAIKPPAGPERLVAVEKLTTLAVPDDLAVISEQETSNDLDPTGSYSLDIENIPKAFADIDFLEIVTREYTEENGIYTNRPIVPSGMLKTTKSLAFTKIYVGNSEISFETESVNGISYRFVGVFPAASEMIGCETCEYPPDLKGHLKKIKNGKIVAELDAEFYIHGC